MRAALSMLAALLLPATATADPRVVTLGGSVTEAAIALGAGEDLVGVDAGSTHPAEVVGDLPQLGYHRQISAEGLLSLGPELVLATEAAGPPEALAQVEAAGVRVIRLPEEADLDGAVARVRGVGEALDRAEEAAALAARLQAETEAAVAAAQAGPRPRVLFLYARGGGHMVVAGAGTAADEIIRLAGGVNAVSAAPGGGYEGYKPLTAEAAVAAAPDVVLVTDGGLEALGGAAGLWQQPGLGLTPAGQRGQVVAVDDLLLLGFGPRLPEAVRTLGAALDAVPAGGSGGGEEG